MSRKNEKLAAEHERAIKWKNKWKELKIRYESLKAHWQHLKNSTPAPGKSAGVPLVDAEPFDSKTFVIRCYKSLLGREPSAEELHHKDGFAAVLDSRHWGREDVMWSIIAGKEFEERVRQPTPEFVPAGHFYSAVPSVQDRMKALTAKNSFAPLAINLAAENQLALLRKFQSFQDDCPFTRYPKEGLRYHYENGLFGWTDGFMLHAFMRHFQPEKIIEIGSGYSSALMLDTREHLLDGRPELTFVEPYPTTVRSLMKPGDEHAVHLIEQPIQEVGMEMFRSLKANDILFIDSTHVSKLGSDVNHLFFEVLPVLAPGVIIHFHDIFFPLEYPDDWIREGRAWNEIYLLRAFLMHNSDYRILLSNSFVHHRFGGWMAEHFPALNQNPGASIWLQKCTGDFSP